MTSKTQAGKIIGYSEIDTRAFLKKVVGTPNTFKTTRVGIDHDDRAGSFRIRDWAKTEITSWRKNAKKQGYNIKNVRKTFKSEKSYGMPIGTRIFIQFDIVKV